MEPTKRCPYCAEEILAAAKKCKHCNSTLDSQESEGAQSTRLLKGFGAIVVGFCVLLWLVNRGSSEDTTYSPAATSPIDSGVGSASAAPLPAAASAPRIRLPKAEQAFIRVVSEAQNRSRSAENDMQRGGIKAQRDKTICAMLQDHSISNWIGHIKTIDSNSDGKGVLEIELSDNITVKTWNNSLSDLGDHTLIEPGGNLFSGVSMMKVGQTVAFSGSFIEETEGPCIKEGSLTLRGTVQDPEFVFRFSTVSAEIQAEE